ncbi:hypothetical protein F4677DRAFT_450720 [Hypoxylon crocopeplum]|nr:hypothetical protein F4677DRAFT_450720 [Hypoxylon crocopeplum]
MSVIKASSSKKPVRKPAQENNDHAILFEDSTNSEDCSSLSYSGIATPTHTMSTGDWTEHQRSYTPKADPTETVPWPGQTYVIKERDTGRLITLADGIITLQSRPTDMGGWHWKVTESNGWLIISNRVSGARLDLDGCSRIYAADYNCKIPRGQFCARRHPEGGYLLLLREGRGLNKLAVVQDDKTLTTTSGDGTLWDFEEIQNYVPNYEPAKQNTSGAFMAFLEWLWSL